MVLIISCEDYIDGVYIYREKKIVGSNNFSAQFIKIISLFEARIALL